jgi:3-phosphoshikimate 1-carboxyvinyltransferase
MNYRITRPAAPLKASLRLPASKSISNRLLIMHALSVGGTQPENLSDSDDTRAMINALRSGEMVKDVGHAGTSMRFLTAYFSSRPGKVRMTGSARMKERPVGQLVDALRELGAQILYLGAEGFPPLEIEGKHLAGGEITIDGGTSSQFISALLMIAPTMRNGLILHLRGAVVSESYIGMTLGLMRMCRADWSREGNTITVPPGQYRPEKVRVESDWSAASYWYVMAFLEEHASVQLSCLERDSLQGDSVLADLFSGFGLFSEFAGDGVTLRRLTRVHPGMFTYDFTNSPDIVQSMAVALCLAGIRFRFSGTQTLRIKETDRILALQTELKKLGYLLNADAGGTFLSWEGERCVPDPEPVISTYHDHRMAMAFAPAALVRGEVRIDDPMVVTKSYPGFWKDLEGAGFKVS